MIDLEKQPEWHDTFLFLKCIEILKYNQNHPVPFVINFLYFPIFFFFAKWYKIHLITFLLPFDIVQYHENLLERKTVKGFIFLDIYRTLGIIHFFILLQSETLYLEQNFSFSLFLTVGDDQHNFMCSDLCVWNRQVYSLKRTET